MQGSFAKYFLTWMGGSEKAGILFGLNVYYTITGG